MRALIVIISFLCAFPAAARENSSQLYTQGAKLAASGQIDEAIEIFKKVITLSPYFALGHYGLGKAYMTKAGRMEDAIKELRAACTLDPSLPKPQFYLGIAYMYSQEYVYAIHAFDAAYKLDRSRIEALYNIGVMYETIGKPYKAQKYYSLWLVRKNSGADDIFNF